LQGISVQQHFFCDGGFTGVGVRNNRKRATPIDFIDIFVGHLFYFLFWVPAGVPK
jgi:hypothetical protein